MTNEQLDRLYEIRQYFLDTQIELSNNMVRGADEAMKYYLDLCDELLDELDPSSDYNTGKS